MSIDEPVRVFINRGSRDYTQRGKLKILDFAAYFNPSSMVNTLSLSKLPNTYRITMDTGASPTITVHLNENNKLVSQNMSKDSIFSIPMPVPPVVRVTLTPKLQTTHFLLQ